ncbi:methylglyoxal synthase [Clostridium thermosuccinogenes]|jgi:methylglyoxal synthase|uniref:Methylglyoxal synthase n=1 Tax=Clostridium thermosuccinogenes TaxID=84032 RepID=A0A2K2FMG3_9CLOT|nr:methylglyoxal synthase [Pseudoclostridium thermosuccinogenes]AUS95666.1 methylglyoxal synthase [Pseudoclostridium thermosuccinogenes]PNT93610.1 methylglyoxal synthase [Pseudoclostridium thermosuccinogenes]PNT99971.1 methylglyoxal synthase [Pseudoclostridium thermosuccinogenes]PNU01416.1 methylglyoxal synthase [Pseudoclostridium thermosuccinogenes]
MNTLKMGKQKHIALIAHDNRKQDLIKWVEKNSSILSRHFLCGTGTTAKLISEQTGLPVTAYKSGPLGGDQQIGARISDGKIDFMIFFWDPLTSQPHDPDVKALLRIAVLYDIPVAMNQSTADFLLSSRLMEEEYDRNVLDYYSRIRKDNF